jgi:hypothetical protein
MNTDKGKPLCHVRAQGRYGNPSMGLSVFICVHPCSIALSA